ncbi:hypothetical protein Rs2_04242 [Raphanus sativus]|nr:hypothetical protein Rs2_04242 [Raphanus sativus]
MRDSWVILLDPIWICPVFYADTGIDRVSGWIFSNSSQRIVFSGKGEIVRRRNWWDSIAIQWSFGAPGIVARFVGAPPRFLRWSIYFFIGYLLSISWTDSLLLVVNGDWDFDWVLVIELNCDYGNYGWRYQRRKEWDFLFRVLLEINLCRILRWQDCSFQNLIVVFAVIGSFHNFQGSVIMRFMGLGYIRVVAKGYHLSYSLKFPHILVLNFPLLFFALFPVTMTQSQWMVKSGGKMVEVAKPKLKISVPRFDNSELIAQYANTVIGRCMNPPKQEMKDLLFMLPRIWQMEARVNGADLGLGRFRFDFEREEDIIAVLRMEPFHFDHWMVSLVRWKPVLEPNYPSKITFWVRVIDVPMQFWAASTFRSVGEAPGQVHGEIDLMEGRVRVELDGFKPLVFSMEVDFAEGVELEVRLRYEKLVGFCRTCNCMTHDQSKCPSQVKKEDEKVEVPAQNTEQGLKAMSYKSAVAQGRDSTEVSREEEFVQDRRARGGDKGKSVAREMQGNYKRESAYRGSQGRFYRGYGEGSSRGGRHYGHGTSREQNQRFAINPRGLQQPSKGEENLSDPQKLMMDAFKGITQVPREDAEAMIDGAATWVRKSLQFEGSEKELMAADPVSLEPRGSEQVKQSGLEDGSLETDLVMRNELELMLEEPHSALDDANFMMEGVLLSDSELLDEEWEEGELPEFTEELEGFPFEGNMEQSQTGIIKANEMEAEDNEEKNTKKKGLKHGVFGGASKKRLKNNLLSPR